ncbi:DUF2142 domain-containing protein [Leifsonia shinshuensis]|uniref:DUF2142 domain-containing protein n=1 Tax=Leifsonia shinshuensis TaxID=150026 RepID=UPI001F50B4F7|nr:DUF2142 domain-containing protein [Leifsonia shinshuensis]MCI0158205.1 DUF2142 domain-containing protein [Leifsonia shinshuensis]
MSSAESVRAGRRSFPTIILIPILIFLALGAWAVSSPIGSSPDDDFHLASTWCGLGDRPGLCEAVPGHADERSVPYAAAETLCNRTTAAQDARCSPAEVAKPHPALVATDRWNHGGQYPRVFYAIQSIFASPDVAVSVIVMRLFNAALFAGVGTLLYFLLPTRRRGTLLWMWSVTVVPLGMFLIASNNPSSWAVIAGGSVWLALVGFFETTGKRMWGLGAVALGTAVMGAGARADAAVYVGVAVAAVAVFEARRTREYALKCILLAGLLVLALLLYRSAGQSGSSGGLVGSHEGSGLSAVGLLWNNLLDLPGLWSGSLGTWGLGWLDTPMPGVVPMFAIGVFGAALFAGAVAFSVRKLLAMIVSGFALAAIPSYVLFAGDAIVGKEVQPRYVLPLLIMFAGFALLDTNGRGLRFTRFQVVATAVALAAANAAALHVNIRRYISGLSVEDPNLNHFVGQWWLGPVSPMVVWVVGTLAFAGAVAIALWSTRVEREEPAELAVVTDQTAAPITR